MTSKHLLGSNDLASEKLGLGVGEVGHVVHNGLGGIAAGGLLEVIQAVPLESGLDAEGRVVAELEDLRFVRSRSRLSLSDGGEGCDIPSRT